MLVKKIYKKRWDGANSSAGTLILIMYLFGIKNILILFELKFGFNGILFLIKNNSFPLAPIGGLIALLASIVIISITKTIKIKNKYSAQREVIKKIRNKSIIYSYVFISFILINLIVTIVIIST